MWGVRDPHSVLTEGAAGAVRGGALVLATGAYDRPVPFPGWTLPGVMTAGAAQSLAKAGATLPGRRVLLVGSGPFLLPVAAQLASSGAEVVAVAEATRRRSWAGAGPQPRSIAARRSGRRIGRMSGLGVDPRTFAGVAQLARRRRTG